MLLAHSDMVHSPVAAADIGERVGSVVDIVADPHEQRVMAFAVHTGGWIGATKFVSPDDVIEYDPHALIVSEAEVLVDPAEILRAHEIVEHHTRILNRPVVTEAGEALGHVIDYVIDTDTAGIVRYHVKSLFGPERIIPATSIVKVTDDSFVVADSQNNVVVPIGDIAEA